METSNLKNYSADWFIEKFEAIPEEMWLINDIGYWDKHCANGHCMNGGVKTNETEALKKTFSALAVHYSYDTFEITDYSDMYSFIADRINNGKTVEYQQPTPKQRILAALYDIKAIQAVEQAKEILSTPVELINHKEETV